MRARSVGVGAAGIAVLAFALGAVAARAPTAHHRLEIAEFRFPPQAVVVSVGDTITWINRDLVPHTVTATRPAWDSGELGRGAEFTIVVTGRDSVQYWCRYHPSMRGRFVVLE